MKKRLTRLLSPSAKLSPLPTGIKSSGTKLKGIRACIFDIYGTLLISGSGDIGTSMKADSIDSFATAFHNCGIQSISNKTLISIKEMFFNVIENTHRLLRKEGYPFPEIDIVKIWAEILSSPEITASKQEIDRISPELIAAAYESVVNPVYPMPGTVELLDQLQKRGCRLGIISNAQFYTPIIMDLVFPEGFDSLGFDGSLSLFSYIERRAKPDTELFLKLSRNLERYGIKPEETVYLGNDMLKDIMPASVCGYKTALFAGDRRSLKLREQDDACSNINPDVIVNKLIDLLNYIQEG